MLKGDVQSRCRELLIQFCEAEDVQQEFTELRKRYWINHWGIGYGAWSTGNITDDMVNEYL